MSLSEETAAHSLPITWEDMWEYRGKQAGEKSIGLGLQESKVSGVPYWSILQDLCLLHRSWAPSEDL